MTALLVGTLLALAALSFVLYPLFMSRPPAGPPTPDRQSGDGEPDRNPALDAPEEIELDRQTGKLSDADYPALKETNSQRTVIAMTEERGPVCITCGPRPESDALYCSNCGAPLTARTPTSKGAVDPSR